MLRLKVEAVLTALAVALAVGWSIPAAARADDGHNHAGHDHAGHNHGEVVAYRLTKWKEMHFDDARKAQQHYKAVKRLGCEVKEDQHSGHVDVAFRCPAWSTVRVSDHRSADRWMSWLKKTGFETKHAHAADERQARKSKKSQR